jgi:hypothetical protein
MKAKFERLKHHNVVKLKNICNFIVYSKIKNSN